MDVTSTYPHCPTASHLSSLTRHFVVEISRMEVIAHARTSSNGRRSHLYGTYNSTLYVINYYCPFGLPPLINKTVGEPIFIISSEVFNTTLKLFQPPAEQVVYLFSKVPFFGSAKNSSIENRALP